MPDSSSKLDNGAGRTNSIAANHRDMCRFNGPKSRDFQRVFGVISQLLNPVAEDGEKIPLLIPVYPFKSKSKV